MPLESSFSIAPNDLEAMLSWRASRRSEERQRARPNPKAGRARAGRARPPLDNQHRDPALDPFLLNNQTQDLTEATRMNIRIATVRDLLWTLVRRAGT
jgi:hypothetical protein